MTLNCQSCQRKHANRLVRLSSANWQTPKIGDHPVLHNAVVMSDSEDEYVYTDPDETPEEKEARLQAERDERRRKQDEEMEEKRKSRIAIAPPFGSTEKVSCLPYGVGLHNSLCCRNSFARHGCEAACRTLRRQRIPTSCPPALKPFRLVPTSL